MKYLIITLLVLNSVVFPQAVRLSNSQLDLIKKELQAQAASTNQEQQKVVDEAGKKLENIVITPPSSSPENYFGYNYFERQISFFDNITPPANFRLGPGDEVILSLWGETNLRKSFILNKDGSIFYANIGFINLLNQTIKEAEQTLLNKLSAIYSTLNDSKNSTKMLLEPGSLRSINVYFTGETKNPGLNLIHPFSDIFTALVQGGIKNSGSLRVVQLIRKNKLINEFDFYSFFTSGKNNFSNVRILDGDIIHIPIVAKRVRIFGEVNNEGEYELLENESLEDLIKFSGDFRAPSSSMIILDSIVPLSSRLSDDNARTKIAVHVNDVAKTNLNNGDRVQILAITYVSTTVDVYGQVKNPGAYPAKNVSLKDILDIAGGFDDPLFRKSIRDDEILILRRDENQFYGLEFEISYNESEKFNLIAGDQIFVYEDYNYGNYFTITVHGEVKKKGTFPLINTMTVGDAIDLAEGLTPLANPRAIIVVQEFIHNENGNIVTTSKNVSNVTLDLIINKNATITVLPYKDMINITGNVYNPGLMAYKQGTTVNHYIKLAGGHRENSLKKKIYIQKANGEIKSVVRGRFKSPKSGDTIVVPVDNDQRDFDVNRFLIDILSVLTNLVAILAIVNHD